MMDYFDDRGAISAKMAVSLIVAITVTALIAAFLLPVAVNALEDDTTKTITQDVGTTQEVNGNLNTTLDSVGTATATDNATYTLETDTQSITKTIDNGTTATYSFTDGDVNVTVDDVNSGSPGDATATYEYPTDFAFSDSAQSLWGLLGLAIVLAVFLAILGLAMDAANRI